MDNWICIFGTHIFETCPAIFGGYFYNFTKKKIFYKIILQYYILYYCIINGFILVFTFIIFYIEADKKYVCVCIYIYIKCIYINGLCLVCFGEAAVELC